MLLTLMAATMLVAGDANEGPYASATAATENWTAQEWSFGGAGWDKLTALEPTNDGGLIAAGLHSSTQLNTFVWILRADANGNIVWEDEFEALPQTYVNELYGLPDGSVTAVGSTGRGGGGAASRQLSSSPIQQKERMASFGNIKSTTYKILTTH